MLRDGLGRAFQMIGLIVLPLAVLAELNGQVRLGQSVQMAIFGAILFAIGTLLRGPRS